MSEQWYWCLSHRRVEGPGQCRADDRLGPYPTQEAARRWRDSLEAREERWEEQDERWHGPKDGWDAEDPRRGP
jgi:hypothetical protein